MDTDELKKLYIENFKDLRTTLHKSIATMAKEMEMSASTLTSYERGDRTVSIELATRLYLTYNVNVNWFVSGKGEMFNNNQSPDDMKKIKDIFNQLLKEHRLIE